MNETRRGPVLVFGCAWLGDMVMSQCLLRALQAQGAGPIDLIASSWNAAAAALLPEVRELIVADFRHGVLDWGKRRRLGRELRAREYAAAYVLPNTLKSALVPFWARIPRRVGWRGEWRYGLLTDCYHPRHAPPHRARSFAALAHPPGAEFELLPPALRLDEARMAAFRERHPDYASGEWIALCPGVARHPIKAWPAERYGQLADWLAGKGRKVALLGSKEDGKYAQA
ncbi:MAG: lipopolysaccharide heptosyltransferase II, partial [Betaproteobacteria bacterium AqS2]|nr:lipopolysaccharide heptosyltransferase II [Betaproteobacteria bacterium AqS2]